VIESTTRIKGGVVHASMAMRVGQLTLRDARPPEADAFATYWHDSGDQHLAFLGIDRAKLGSREETRARFLRMIRTPATEQASVVFTITLNDEVIGYTNLNRYGPDDNYPHLHTYRSSVRAARQAAGGDEPGRAGAGLARVLVGPILGMFFDLFPIRRLVLQTRTRNVGINRALDAYLPAAETRHFDDPDGVAGPGEFHMRYVYRDDVPWMLERSQALARAA
jgi:RimJ/RimL family protein N-acetyltransferase